MPLTIRPRSLTGSSLFVSESYVSPSHNCTIRIDDDPPNLTIFHSFQVYWRIPPGGVLLIEIITSIHDGTLNCCRKHFRSERISAELLHLEPIWKRQLPRQNVHRDGEFRQRHLVCPAFRESRS